MNPNPAATASDLSRTRLSFALLIATACSLMANVHAEDATRLAFFEKTIRPVLIEHCYECHSSDSEDLQAGLLLDTRAGIRRGGESGAAVVPGDIDSSLLISSIKYEDFEMPPKGKLPDSVINDFVTWVKMGAADPRDGDAAVKPVVARHHAESFWSFQPIKNPGVPSVLDQRWPRGPIDSFILARLDREGLRPAEDAKPETLIRRLYVDLIGLPPTPEELRRWTIRIGDVDSDQDAVGELVDHLLDSPHFGERWGRHWLDVARYADSTGGGNSAVLPDAWKYRDYVIDSFNSDTPYDRFIHEQIAGDLIPEQDVQQRAQNLAATGFLVLGPRSYITDDAVAFEADGIDEQVDTIGRVFLGMTVGCSRCHDHKFDAISHADYHALAGILKSTRTAVLVPLSKNYTWNLTADPREDSTGEQLARFEEASLRVKAVLKQATLVKKAVASARTTGILPPNAEEESVEEWIATQEQTIAGKQREAAELRKDVPPKPATLMAARCQDQPADMCIQLRGNPHRSGDSVSRGFPNVITKSMSGHPAQPNIHADESGRRELAQWLASPENPLTARVFVNRVWKHMFGHGLVSTPDNFGTTGTLPTHPQLLNWLAHHFINERWSIKTLIRQIAMSRTYQLGGGSPDNVADPGNELWGRRVRRSLDAETLRDTMLTVSAELDRTQGGPSFPAKLRLEFSHKFRSLRRSVYVPRFRNHPLEMFQAFDAANPTLVVGDRDQTILPTQALFLINNNFVIERCKASAQRILDDETPSIDDKIDLLYRRTLCRSPTPVETTLARDFIEDAGNVSVIDLWTGLQQTLFECVDFRFVK